jgi:hypothetical protein
MLTFGSRTLGIRSFGALTIFALMLNPMMVQIPNLDMAILGALMLQVWGFLESRGPNRSTAGPVFTKMPTDRLKFARSWGT